MIPVLVFTSDTYLKAVRPFAYLFNRYWEDEILVDVVGFKEPEFDLPDNFSFFSLGGMSSYPINCWSNAVLDYLAPRTEIKHFILMLEDYWITREVNHEAIVALAKYAQDSPSVLKVDLCADRLYAKGMTDYGTLGNLELVKSAYNSPYHMSLMTGIWNRDLFCRFVVPGETPWQVELNGTSRVAEAKDDVLVIGTKQWPLKHTLAYRGGNANHLLSGEIRAEDMDMMKELGYL